MLTPPDATREILRDELPGAEAWAKRHAIQIVTSLETLSLSVSLPPPITEVGPFDLVADFADYKTVPPAWRFVDRNSGDSPRSAWPAGGSVPGVGSSVLHSNAVICAPFNRLAYKEHGGPHGDWSGATNWLSVGSAHVRATTVGEMLAVIWLHLLSSSGRLT